MSKKSKNHSTKSHKPAPPAKVIKTTPPRNSPVPKTNSPAPATRREVTYEMVAKRAYEIFRGGTGGDEMHNWLRAERELRSGI